MDAAASPLRAALLGYVAKDISIETQQGKARRPEPERLSGCAFFTMHLPSLGGRDLAEEVRRTYADLTAIWRGLTRLALGRVSSSTPACSLASILEASTVSGIENRRT